MKEGDEVSGNLNETPLRNCKRSGTLSDFTAVEENIVAIKPKNLRFAEAASLPLDLLTAYQGFGLKEFTTGKSVLISVGAGGVGSLAIQVCIFSAHLRAHQYLFYLFVYSKSMIFNMSNFVY